MTEFLQKHETVVIAQTATASASFSPPPWATFIGAYFPDMDAGAVDLEMSIDGGTIWVDVIDPADGVKVVVLASASDPGGVDISDFIRPFVGVFAGGAQAGSVLFRFVSATAQTTAAITIHLYYRG